MRVTTRRTLFGLLLATLCAPTPASHAAERVAANSVQSVEYGRLAGGAYLVRIELQHPLAAPPAAFRTHHPVAHIVFDFPDTSLAVKSRSIDVDSRLLRAIRMAEQRSRTRLALHLQAPASYETVLQGNHFLVLLRPSARPAPAALFPRFGAARIESAHRVHDVAFQRGASGAGVVIVRLSDAGAGVHFERQGLRLVLAVVNAAISPERELRLDVLDFATPIYTIETRASGGDVRMSIEADARSEVSVFQSGAQLIVAAVPLQDAELALSRYH